MNTVKTIGRLLGLMTMGAGISFFIFHCLSTSAPEGVVIVALLMLGTAIGGAVEIAIRAVAVESRQVDEAKAKKMRDMTTDTEKVTSYYLTDRTFLKNTFTIRDISDILNMSKKQRWCVHQVLNEIECLCGNILYNSNERYDEAALKRGIRNLFVALHAKLIMHIMWLRYEQDGKQNPNIFKDFTDVIARWEP